MEDKEVCLMNRDVPKGIIIVTILVGIILFFGTTIYKIINNYNHIDYIETTAILEGVSSVKTDDNGQHMYYLKYKYIINGQDYYYITDYSVSDIPKDGSTTKIKYNPINPDEAYSKSFDVFSIFQIIGAFFLFVSLIMLFSYWIWFRDIMIFLGTGSLIITLIKNNFYTGGFMLALIILGILCFASIMDFIMNLKDNQFNPLEDIKRDIAVSKEIKNRKKQINKGKIKRIIKGILLFIIPLPLVIFMDIQIGYPNQVIYYIFVIISVICMFVGFFIVGMTLMGSNSDVGVIKIAGKVIDNEDIKNLRKMTIIEKIKTLNIIGVIIRILLIPAFLGIMTLIMIDPLNFFSIFENVVRAQLFTMIGITLIGNMLYLLFNQSKFSRFSIVMFVVGYIVTYLLVYSMTSP